jgi:predicted secreted protein with PEFG-CTERM motif
MSNYRKFVIPLFAVLFAISMISTTALQNNAYAGLEPGMSVSVTASEGSGQISIGGYTGAVQSDAITITVVAPNGNIVAIDQLSADSSGNFSTDISTGGAMWGQDGTYTIKLNAGSGGLYVADFDVDITNGTTDGTSTNFSNLGTYDDGYETKLSNVTEGSTGLSISADAVEGATSFTINGSTDRTQSAVTLTVVAPNGNIVTVDQISPDSDGTFSSEIGVGGPMWSQDGLYSVTAIQGDATAYQSTVQVDIADGAVIPEFGTIAALVLVVAIASIIAITAKSRVSLMPKL